MKRFASYFLAGALLLSGFWLLPAQSQISYAPNVLQSTLFTTVGANTFTVPFNKTLVWVSGVGGGGGGGGGHATGGGGGGGGGSCGINNLPVPVTPGSTLTITVGAKGTAGAIGADGVRGFSSLITGALIPVIATGYGTQGLQGAATNGGNGGRTSCWADMISNSGGTGGAAAGAATPQYGNGIGFNGAYILGSGAGSGAGTGSGGGGGGRCAFSDTNTAGGANIGGGAGGCSMFGAGGTGGATTTAGNPPAAGQYGAGGGGGGQNAAGAAGTDGAVLIMY